MLRQRVNVGVAQPNGETEVENLDLPLVAQHDVGGLDVPVHETAVMRVRDGLRKLHGVLDELVERQPGGANDFLQRVAFDVLHRDIRLAVGLADLVDRAHVRVIERARATGLLQ